MITCFLWWEALSAQKIMNGLFPLSNAESAKPFSNRFKLHENDPWNYVMSLEWVL